MNYKLIAVCIAVLFLASAASAIQTESAFVPLAIQTEPAFAPMGIQTDPGFVPVAIQTDPAIVNSRIIIQGS
ncbi:MAG: hypothetical protein ABH854_02755 [Candidatus Diapherotrites archaeon]|nr:hypothetical protein [Candidatus Micrarchaeota archaeon]MBU1939515.1 hypothetical protein [Candidatus Micrarchaeota archaeon]